MIVDTGTKHQDHFNRGIIDGLELRSTMFLMSIGNRLEAKQKRDSTSAQGLK